MEESPEAHVFFKVGEYHGSPAGGYRAVGGDESAVEFIKPKGFGSIYAYRTN